MTIDMREGEIGIFKKAEYNVYFSRVLFGTASLLSDLSISDMMPFRHYR
jgi:hypothetical protein